MARRKRRHTTTHRKRRVSGVGNIDVTVVALLVGGAVVSRVITNKLAASTNTTFAKFAPYIAVVGGVAGLMFMKSPMIKALSYGLIAGGSISALGSTGLKVISGIEGTISGRMGYPPNVLRRVSGTYLPNGNYVNKSNFSGSGKSQMNVINGVNHVGGSGSGSGNCIN